jgi:hypothetical protein
MSKETWMYTAIAVAIVGGYFYYQNSQIKTAINTAGSTRQSIATVAGVTLTT